MELSGEERRIQSLFRELKLDDQRMTPSFTREWARSPARAARSKPGLTFLRIVVAVALICAVLIGVALMVMQRRQPRLANKILNNSEPQAALKVERNAPAPSPPGQPGLKWRPLVHRKLARPSTESSIASVNQPSAEPSIEISRWQSPTTKLLSLPGERLLKSIPQIDQSARELKSFLPDRLN